MNVYSCSRCSFSTLRYDKLKEHLHKQHKVGSAPERRVRITDLVNLDLAKTVEGSVSGTVGDGDSTQPQSLGMPDLDQPVELDGSGDTSPEKQQTVVDTSVILVEPTDLLLSSVQPYVVRPVVAYEYSKAI